MASRSFARALALSLLAAPFAHVACGGDDDRQFSDTGGAGGTAGAGGGIGGSSGSGGGLDGGTPCSGNAECDDENPCNGVETCSGGFCAAGTALGNGTTCTPSGGSGDAGAEYICANGACVGKCESDEDCNDNDLCTGTEVCSAATNSCVSGAPLTCDDNDACTEDKCDPEQGCYFELMDKDGDGHADQALGSCGTDCDDNDPDVYQGAPELCDNKDNNCNGQTDELAPTWYVDCDGDGFAPAGAASVQQCSEPTTPHASCTSTGKWTAKVPAAGTTDCWDLDPNVRPMTATESNTAWSPSPISGAPVSVDYDYNCDGLEEKRWPTGFVSTSAACTFQFTGGGLGYCSGAAGWSGASPACGATGTYSSCSLLSGCTRSVNTSAIQQCR